MTAELKASEAVTTIFDLIDDVKLDLGLNGLYEGDQTLLPTTPSVCVYAGNTTREYTGSSFRYTAIGIEVYVMVYHCALKSNTVTERECNELAESIITVVDSDETLGGRALDVLVTSIEPGESEKGKNWYRSSRLTVRIVSRFNYGAP